MKIGDLITCQHGEGRIVNGRNYGKGPARGGKWVFLFFVPEGFTERVVLYRPSELRLRQPGERDIRIEVPLPERKTVKPKISRKKRSNYKVTVLPDAVPAGAGAKRTRELAKQGYKRPQRWTK